MPGTQRPAQEDPEGERQAADDDDFDAEDLDVAIVERRAAFDLGSGTFKLAVADVDIEASRVIEMVFSEERPVDLWGGSVGADRLELAQRELQRLTELAKAHGAVDYAAVATGVFRDSAQCRDWLAGLEAGLGLCATVVTELEETRLAVLTVVQLSRQNGH